MKNYLKKYLICIIVISVSVPLMAFGRVDLQESPLSSKSGIDLSHSRWDEVRVRNTSTIDDDFATIA